MAGTITASVVKNDTTSPPQFQNSAGTQIGTLCRAWVNFDGTTAAIRASFNVGSITKNGTGDYTVNFTNAMSDANYSVNGTASAETARSFMHIQSATALTASSVRMFNQDVAGGGRDQAQQCIAIFR